MNGKEFVFEELLKLTRKNINKYSKKSGKIANSWTLYKYTYCVFCKLF